MNPPRRAKIIESEYIEKSDLIKWNLEFLDNGHTQIYVWPSIDLITSLGIKGKVTPADLHLFCKNMHNKEINFISEFLEKSKILTEKDISSEHASFIADNIVKNIGGL
jgi:hypothetical protein